MYGYEARDDKAVRSDWDECLARATADGVHLESLHIQALVFVLRRPIIVYGDRFGGLRKRIVANCLCLVS